MRRFNLLFTLKQEMIKELKKRNGPSNGHAQLRTRQQSKKEINIEDLIEGK